MEGEKKVKKETLIQFHFLFSSTKIKIYSKCPLQTKVMGIFIFKKQKLKSKKILIRTTKS